MEADALLSLTRVERRRAGGCTGEEEERCPLLLLCVRSEQATMSALVVSGVFLPFAEKSLPTVYEHASTARVP